MRSSLLTILPVIALMPAVAGGSVYVGKQDSKYYINWDLESSDVDLTCTLDDKRMSYESETFSTLSSGGKEMIIIGPKIIRKVAAYFE